MDIDKELIAYLDNRYVQKDDCNDRHKATENEIKEILIVQTQSKTKLDNIEKLNSVEVAALVTAIVGAIVNLILK